MSSEQVRHGFVETNGIRMHYAEAGSGPLVVLLHGFPELWRAWRHQMGPLAAAGYRVVAPDMRGFGQTSCPAELEAYDVFQITGDIVGLVKALGETSAVIAGHDWGSWIASYLALLRPDMFRALAMLSVPYVPRRALSQSEWEQLTYPGKVFYQAGLRFAAADQYLQMDVRGSLLRGLHSLSGQAPPEERFRAVRAPGHPSGQPPATRPAWITEEEVDLMEAEFRRTGFTGGLNYYRNMDRNWALTPFLDGARILQPSIFIAGEKDPVLEFHGSEVDGLEANVPRLRKKVLLEGVGHWTQQESPAEVNSLLVGFLGGL